VTPSRTLPCIAAAVDRAVLSRIAARVAPPHRPPATRELLYPYYRYVFRSTTTTLLGRRAIHISCLVDARTGAPATSDPFDVTPCTVSATDVLEPVLSEPEARDVARRLAGHAARARRRVLVADELELLEQGLVHKPFVVVTGGRAPLLVDGVTGATCPTDRAPESTPGDSR